MPDTPSVVIVNNSEANAIIDGTRIMVRRTENGPWLPGESRFAEGPWLRVSYTDAAGREHMLQLLNGRLTIDGREPRNELSVSLRNSMQRLEQAMVEYNNQGMPGAILGSVWNDLQTYERALPLLEQLGDKLKNGPPWGDTAAAAGHEPKVAGLSPAGALVDPVRSV